MSYQNDLLLRTIRGEKTERTPVWLMRQAGRILPQYRSIRKKLSGFKELVTTPELAAEVTIQPVDHLEVDAAIIFSDILVIPEAMGLSYEMIEEKGPFFPEPVTEKYDFNHFRKVDPQDDLRYVLGAIEITKKELNGRVPLIGFAGAPWTLFCYMVEGHGSKTFSKARRWLYKFPDRSHQLLDLITESTISYLRAQIQAGADLVQVFDSWAGILPPGHYQEFSIPYLQRICKALPEAPLILFSKGANFARESLAELGSQAIGLDWQMDIRESRALVGEQKILQGNLDPCVLYGSKEVIQSETRKMLDAFGPDRHIANLGHGVYPDTNPDHVRFFVDAVKEYSARMKSEIS